MIALDLVGIGVGDPDHLTLGAVRALTAADVVLLPRKGAEKAELAALRRALLDAVRPTPARLAPFDMPARRAEGDYLGAVADWHDAIADAWDAALAAALPDGGRAALMVWGDPGLYDSTLRVAERLRARGLVGGVRVHPGVTAIQALTAAHAVPLNDVGAPVAITTGRRLRAEGWPPGVDSVAVMLDAGGAFTALDLADKRIWWGANVGRPEQSLVAGPLAEVGPTILAERARLRAAQGWVMDVYLIRRETGAAPQSVASGACGKDAAADDGPADGAADGPADGARDARADLPASRRPAES